MRSFLKENDMMAYLSMMAVRLLELHRVLKPTGALYLHCDPTASHYLKILLDSIFGKTQFVNEIIWRRTGSHNARRSFGPVHDVIHVFAKTNSYAFNIVRRPYMKGHVESRYTMNEKGEMRFTSGGNVLTGAGIRTGESGARWRQFDPTAKRRHWAIPGYYDSLMPPAYLQLSSPEKLEALLSAGYLEISDGAAWPTMVRYLDERDGVPLQDIWAYQPYTDGTVWGTNEGIDEDVAWLGPTDPDRLGYATQKPIGLLERILSASSNEGDVVLDPFCGCGTTVHAAEKLKRHWIGIDVTHLAISLIRRRLIDAFPYVQFDVHGVPKDIGAAQALSDQDKHQFQLWALSVIEAQPYKGGQKGADGGVDGYLYFKPDGKVTEKAVVSVKGGGNVGVGMIRDLIATVDREKAKIGVFLTLEDPTTRMLNEATAAGFYQPDMKFEGNREARRYEKIQILTIEDLFGGKRPHIPWVDPSVFKRAKRETSEKQSKLDL
jgi:DNA modification methylase